MKFSSSVVCLCSSLFQTFNTMYYVQRSLLTEFVLLRSHLRFISLNELICRLIEYVIFIKLNPVLNVNRSVNQVVIGWICIAHEIVSIDLWVTVWLSR